MIEPNVIKVVPTNNYELIIYYETGEVKIYDVKPLLNLGIFKLLKNKKLFNTVRPSANTIEWPNAINKPGYCSEIDIAPETLYYDSVDYDLKKNVNSLFINNNRNNRETRL